jgi:hypothetical protein
VRPRPTVLAFGVAALSFPAFAYGASAAAQTTQAAAAPSPSPAFHPINPATLPSSSIDTDFAPADAAALKAAFARYIAYVHAHGDRLDRLPPEPSLHLKTIAGTTIDSKALFLELNAVQARLASSGLSLASSALPRTVPIAKAFGTPTPLATPAPKPTPAGGAPSPTPLPLASPNNLPSSSVTCAPQTPEPRIFDSERGWQQIQTLAANPAAGGTLNRCDLDFEPMLTEVESGSPKGVVPDIVATTPPLSFGKTKLAGGSFANEVGFRKNGTVLSIESDVRAFALNQSFDVLRIDASVDRSDPKNLAAQLAFSVGQASIYKIDGSTNPNYSFHITPQKVVGIVPSFRQHYGPAEFEVDCEGKVGIDGKVVTTPYGVYVSAKPTILVQIDGGLSVNYIFAEGRLTGSLELVDSSGELGAIAAVLPDTTIAQFDPTFAQAPLVAIVRPFGHLSVTALKSSLTVQLRLVGNVTVFSQKIPISGGLDNTFASLDAPWSVYYVAPGKAGG